MKQWLSKGYWLVLVLLILAIVVGQVVSFLAARASWEAFVALLPKYLSMVAFWGPIVALVSGLLVWTMLKLLGFNSLAEIRKESVAENNPAPAIIFIGTMIASILFMMLILRP
jgi:predicted lysophospholipase L1 biosynthesis ABC-type transport system permease subunit